MSSKTTYTAHSSCIIPIVFKCKHCGKTTSVKHVLRSTAMKSTNSFSSQVHEETREEAQIEADKFNVELREQVIEEAKKHKYSHADFKCKCSHCNKKPLWAKMSYDRTLFAIFILGFLTFMTFLFSLLPLVDGNTEKAVSGMLKTSLPLLAVVIVLIIGMTIHKKIVSKKILNMDEKYLPVICSTTTEIEQAMEELSK